MFAVTQHKIQPLHITRESVL